MQKNVKLFLISLLTLQVSFVYGQYSISNKTETEPIYMKRSLMPPRITPEPVITEALLKFQRKQKRKARNYVEFKPSLTLNQISYKNTGNRNTFNGRISTYLKYNYNNQKKLSLTSEWNAAYGLGDNDGKLWKTEDWFQWNNNVSYQIYKKWNYTFTLNVRSQFANTFNSVRPDKVLQSQFFSPVTINTGFGVNYKIDDNRYFIFTPVSGNVVMVCNEELSKRGVGGVVRGRLGKGSFGASAQLKWEHVVWKHPTLDKVNLLKIRTQASSFTDYETIPNLNWQTWFEMGITRYFSVTFYCQLSFNDQINTPRNSFWQYNHTLSIGLNHTIKNK